MWYVECSSKYHGLAMMRLAFGILTRGHCIILNVACLSQILVLPACYDAFVELVSNRSHLSDPKCMLWYGDTVAQRYLQPYSCLLHLGFTRRCLIADHSS